MNELEFETENEVVDTKPPVPKPRLQLAASEKSFYILGLLLTTELTYNIRYVP